MKKQNNAGYSLIEVLVAIALLGALVVPISTSLVMGHRMNLKATQLLEAQLAVSSAVETLMAEGIAAEDDSYDVRVPEGETEEVDRFPNVTVATKQATDGEGNALPYYEVTVTSKEEPSVSVFTYIRKGGADA